MYKIRFCVRTSRRGRESRANVKEVPRMRYFKGWTILDEACMRTTRWEMSEGLVGNTHWRKVDVGILMQEGKSGVWLP